MLPKPDCVFAIPSLQDDLELDGRLYFPRRPADTQGPYVKGFAILAHPYAPLGGSFDDPVVQVVGSVLLRQGFVLNTFNFRGATSSAGSTSWTGKAELGDFSSFYAFMLYLVNMPNITGSITRSAHRGSSDQPILILGGYSFGSLIASHSLPLDVMVEALASKPIGSAEHEIYVKAAELSKALLGFLEFQDRRGRNSRRSADASDLSPSKLSLKMGGYDSEMAGHRVSRESSRRSLDLDSVRRSVDRIKHRIGSRGEMAHDAAHDPGTEETTAPILTVMPRIVFLLVSPLLPPISGLLTLFAHPSFDFHGRVNVKSSDRQLSNLSKNSSLAVFGSKDNFTSSRKLRKWCEDINAHPGASLKWREIDEAGHFWRESGVEAKLRHEVSQWTTNLMDTS